MCYKIIKAFPMQKEN